MIISDINALQDLERDICVIGAGPVGMSLALELSRRGKTVLLLESGGEGFRKDLQLLSDVSIMDSSRHVPISMAVQRRLGGASNLWGGGCVSMDPLDFESRPGLESTWPISSADLRPFWPAACQYLGCGEAVFEDSIAGLEEPDKDFLVNRLERWSLRPNLRTAYSRELRESQRLTLCLLATAVAWVEL